MIPFRSVMGLSYYVRAHAFPYTAFANLIVGFRLDLLHDNQSANILLSRRESSKFWDFVSSSFPPPPPTLLCLMINKA